MGWRCQLQFKPVYGSMTRGDSWSFAGRAAWRRARKRAGAVTNLIALGNPDKGALDYKTTQVDETSEFPIGPSYRIVYNNDVNQRAAWTAISGGDYLGESPWLFGPRIGSGHNYGLRFGLTKFFDGAVFGFENGLFYSDTSVIQEMAPFSLKFRLWGPAQGLEFPVVSWRIPNGRNRGVQFAIERGQAYFRRLTDAWTQTQEDALHALLNQETIDDADQASIDALRLLIYADERQVDLPGELHGVTHEIAFIPEPCGKVSILDGQGRFLTQYRDSNLLSQRVDGKVWRDSRLYVRSNGPAVDWQVGRLQQAVTGRLRLGRVPKLIAGSTDYEFAMIASVPAGTSITMSNEELPPGDPVVNEIVVDFAVDAPLGPMPLFYAGHAIRFPGVRSGYTETVLLDTANLALSPVEEGAPEFEPHCRRQSWTFTLRNVNGAFTHALQSALVGTGLQHPYATGAHLQLDVLLGTAEFGMTKVLTNGIVTFGGHGGMKTAEEIVLAPGWETAAFKGESKGSLTVNDQWKILDDWLMEVVRPVGDGKYLGAYIRDCLRCAGLDPAEYAGVSATAGRVLPQARPGEDWLVMPSASESLGNWLRHLLDLYGMGRQLWQDNTTGVWQFGFRSTLTVHTFNTGDKVETFLDPLDFYQEPAPNFFRVTGGEGVDGMPLGATFQRWRAIVPQGGAGSRHYVGRQIQHPPVRDSSLVTLDDCYYACYSLYKLYSKPGRGLKTTTWWKFGIFPGDYVTGYAGAPNQDYEVTAVQSGSIAYGSPVRINFLDDPEDLFKGQLGLVLREIEP